MPLINPVGESSVKYSFNLYVAHTWSRRGRKHIVVDTGREIFINSEDII